MFRRHTQQVDWETYANKAVADERERIRQWAYRKKEATKVYASVYEITAGAENAVLDELVDFLDEPAKP